VTNVQGRRFTDKMGETEMGTEPDPESIRSLAPDSGYIFRIRIWIFGKNGSGAGSGFSMYGMMHIECMLKHGRDEHIAGFGVKNLEANWFRIRFRS